MAESVTPMYRFDGVVKRYRAGRDSLDKEYKVSILAKDMDEVITKKTALFNGAQGYAYELSIESVKEVTYG